MKKIIISLIAASLVLIPSMPSQSEEAVDVKRLGISISGGAAHDFGPNILPVFGIGVSWQSPLLNDHLSFYGRSRMANGILPIRTIMLDIGTKYLVWDAGTVKFFGDLGLGLSGNNNSAIPYIGSGLSSGNNYSWGFILSPGIGIDIPLSPYFSITSNIGLTTWFAGAYIYGMLGMNFNI